MGVRVVSFGLVGVAFSRGALPATTCDGKSAASTRSSALEVGPEGVAGTGGESTLSSALPSAAFSASVLGTLSWASFAAGSFVAGSFGALLSGADVCGVFSCFASSSCPFSPGLDSGGAWNASFVSICGD